jgi:hypothetical protein
VLPVGTPFSSFEFVELVLSFRYKLDQSVVLVQFFILYAFGMMNVDIYFYIFDQKL